MTSQEPVVALESVSRSYGNVTALVDVSLEVNHSELVVINGASGAGKSTLLGILGLMDEPDEGHYRLHGQLVSELSDTERASIRNRQFGFVFQQYALIPNLSVWQNVARPLTFAGVGRRERQERALQMLNESGLAHLAHRRPAQLSGGEQQRVAIARAKINSPSVILADEPTGSLPVEQWQPILDDLERLRALGRAIIVISHDNAVIDRASRVLRLTKGRLQELDHRHPARRPAQHGGLRLHLLGVRTIIRNNEEMSLTRRQAELLALLASEPRGLTGEQLLLRAYGDDGSYSSVKANLSRLRATVKIASQPYRIDEPFSSDLEDLFDQIRTGRIDEAVDTYAGPLLSESTAPGITELRDHAEESLRQAVVVNGSADATFRLAERIAEDLELWELAHARLAPEDSRKAIAAARIAQFQRDWT